MIKHETVGDIDIVGNCDEQCCVNDKAGYAIQLQQGDSAITIPLNDLEKVRAAMLKVVTV